MKWLVLGGNGWIGKKFCNYLREMNQEIIYAESRADFINDLENEIVNVEPDRIVSLIGRTYGPGFNTIDYLEQKGKLIENIRDNLFGPLAIALIAKKYGIHFTYLGTGCIFNGYQNDIGYDENDLPDFFGSSYSVVKGYTDRLMHLLEDDILNIRIRMPIDSEPNPRNFITKIMKYEKICSIPNSMTVLPELLPIMIDMALKKYTGTVNLTNPGLISHNEILEMVKEIIDPDFEWKNFSLEEQNQILAAGRSNNLLNTNKLETLYPTVLPIRDAVRKVLIEMKKYI